MRLRQQRSRGAAAMTNVVFVLILLVAIRRARFHADRRRLPPRRPRRPKSPPRLKVSSIGTTACSLRPRRHHDFGLDRAERGEGCAIIIFRPILPVFCSDGRVIEAYLERH